MDFTAETDPPAFGPAWPNEQTAAKRPASTWSDPVISNRVKELWRDHSASEIRIALRSEFGVSVSRNAIVGFLHRAKLTVEHKTKIHRLTRDKVSGPRAPRFRITRVNSNSNQRRVMPTFAAAELKALRCAEVVTLDIGLQHLTDKTCRWPVGDGPFVFCGTLPHPGKPYCANHYAISLRP